MSRSPEIALAMVEWHAHRGLRCLVLAGQRRYAKETMWDIEDALDYFEAVRSWAKEYIDAG